MNKGHTYVIGDIHGCYKTLLGLLELIEFNKNYDQLILTGDLINRGPSCLDVLDLVKDLGSSAIPILGNHELYILLSAYGILNDENNFLAHKQKYSEYLQWIRTWPFIYKHKSNYIVHAGLSPLWTLDQATNIGNDLHSMLSGDNYMDILKLMSSNFIAELEDNEIANQINTMCYMRKCNADGLISSEGKPWYYYKRDISDEQRIIFGHWSDLGLMITKNYICLDSGCVWGKKLTALRLSDDKIFQIDNLER